MVPNLRPRPLHNGQGGRGSVADREEPPRPRPRPTAAAAAPPPPPPPPPPCPYVDVGPHPTHGFRVVRLTLGLVNPNTLSLDTRSIELCFHDDFQAFTERPLSFHMDRRYMSLYYRPLLLTAPPPPGVILDVGRVDVLPDDTELVRQLEGQIRRELAEEIQRRAQESPSPGRRVIHLARVAARLAWTFVDANRSRVVLILSLLLIPVMVILMLYSCYLSSPSEPTSPVPLVPLANHVATMALDTTQLTPIIFFNPFFYATITDGSNSTDNPEKILSKLQMLRGTWNMTDHLVRDFVHKSISREEFRRYMASNQTADDSRRLLKPDLWEYNGLRWKDIRETWARGQMLYNKAMADWPSVGTRVFALWTLGMDESIAFAIRELEFAPVSSASSMFIAPETGLHNGTTTPVSALAGAKMPREIPSEVRSILNIYRDHIAQSDFLSSSCKVLQECATPLPDSAPSSQVLHPSCQLCRDGDCSPEAMVKNVEEWSAAARGKNLTWRDETGSNSWAAKSFLPNRMAESFWPNKTEFPLLFDQAMRLGQLKDAMNQMVEVAEIISHANREKEGRGIVARFKGWAKGEQDPFDPVEETKQLKEILEVRLWRQLRDVSQGIQAVSSICDGISALGSLVDDLYSPSNWIIKEDNADVMLQKMAHPKDQAKALATLRQELIRRLGVLNRYYQMWNQLDEVLEDKRKSNESEGEE
ncbi:hypothetical protein ACHAPT_013045 [Fusarium lateritium]